MVEHAIGRRAKIVGDGLGAAGALSRPEVVWSSLALRKARQFIPKNGGRRGARDCAPFSTFLVGNTGHDPGNLRRKPGLGRIVSVQTNSDSPLRVAVPGGGIGKAVGARRNGFHESRGHEMNGEQTCGNFEAVLETGRRRRAP